MNVETKSVKVYIGAYGEECETAQDAVTSLVVDGLSDLLGPDWGYDIGEDMVVIVKHRDVVIRMLQSVDEYHSEA
jgi:hypothetical protein